MTERYARVMGEWGRAGVWRHERETHRAYSSPSRQTKVRWAEEGCSLPKHAGRGRESERGRGYMLVTGGNKAQISRDAHKNGVISVVAGRAVSTNGSHSHCKRCLSAPKGGDLELERLPSGQTNSHDHLHFRHDRSTRAQAGTQPHTTTRAPSALPCKTPGAHAER